MLSATLRARKGASERVFVFLFVAEIHPRPPDGVHEIGKSVRFTQTDRFAVFHVRPFHQSRVYPLLKHNPQIISSVLTGFLQEEDPEPDDAGGRGFWGFLF